ncbi:hypothetical protein BZA70DRAFT_279031 [Myxozyma melibiosi]|uniref:Uncharacterized protein n=1 Tax=Myxozyma melibiosi TaxID=54550 RepID=A0ABR1F5K9_9ASCO
MKAAYLTCSLICPRACPTPRLNHCIYPTPASTLFLQLPQYPLLIYIIHCPPLSLVTSTSLIFGRCEQPRAQTTTKSNKIAPGTRGHRSYVNQTTSSSSYPHLLNKRVRHFQRVILHTSDSYANRYDVFVYVFASRKDKSKISRVFRIEFQTPTVVIWHPSAICGEGAHLQWSRPSFTTRIANHTSSSRVNICL